MILNKIIIKDLISSNNAVSMEQGSLLYVVLKEIMNQDDQIELSFEGLSVIASPFFNASISYLTIDHEVKEILEKIKMINIPDYAKDILNQSFHNAVLQKNKSH